MASNADASRSYISEIVRSCLAGSSFGAALTLARVYLPSIIIDQMRLKDFHMLEVFLSATSLSSLVFLSLEKLGVTQRVTRANSALNFFQNNLSQYDGNILGGALIGTGMALAGACPGTVIIQLAQGLPIARVTTFGAILGGTAWVLTGDKVVRSSSSAAANSAKAAKSSITAPSKIDSKPTTQANEKVNVPLEPVPQTSQPSKHPLRTTIPEALNLSPTTTYISFLLLMSSTIAASVVFFPGKSQATIPTVLAGTLVALAQTISLTVASTPLGTSAAYEQIGQHIAAISHTALGTKRVERPTFPPKSIIFTMGMALGSVLVSRYDANLFTFFKNIPLFDIFPSSSVSPASLQVGTAVNIPKVQALIGGVALSYGARMAGGCTSGHGISGLSSLSWASLISVVSMFGGGIAVRLALDFVGL